jgi:hypothetical protein
VAVRRGAFALDASRGERIPERLGMALPPTAASIAEGSSNELPTGPAE